MTADKVARKIDEFIKKKLRGCHFNLYPMSGAIRITLGGGDFTPYFVEPSKSMYNCVYVQARGNSSSSFAKHLDPNRVSSLVDGITLTKESIDAFKKIMNFIKDNFSHIDDPIQYAFMIDHLDIYKNTGVRQGTISKPTEIEHKTFKGRKRRGVAEAVKPITAPPVAKKLEQYLKQKFRGCNFSVAYDSFRVRVYLKERPFPAFNPSFYKASQRLKDNLYPVNVNRHYAKLNQRTVHYFDPDGMVTGFMAIDLTKEVIGVFYEIAHYIMDNFGGDEYYDIEYYFYIFGSDDKNYEKRGTISKPTDIEHKPFKGRKRRSVAEAIKGVSMQQNDFTEMVDKIERTYKDKFGSSFIDFNYTKDGDLAKGSEVVFDYYIKDPKPIYKTNIISDIISIGVTCDLGYRWKVFVRNQQRSGSSFESERDVFILRFIKKHKLVMAMNSSNRPRSSRVYQYQIDVDNIGDIRKIFDDFLKEVKTAISGHIPDPTKIDHKTFKGRKRRSVAEAIMGGF